MGELVTREETQKAQLPAVKMSKEEREALTKVLLQGDLGKLSEVEKWCYYKNYCDMLGMNPYTMPFGIINAQGKQVLYAKKGAAEQLAHKFDITVKFTAEYEKLGVYVVVACASTPDGRQAEAKGAVPIENLKGEALANALMKAETKAHRRAVLRLVGLGALDESEIGLDTERMDVAVVDKKTVAAAKAKQQKPSEKEDSVEAEVSEDDGQEPVSAEEGAQGPGEVEEESTEVTVEEQDEPTEEPTKPEAGSQRKPLSKPNKDRKVAWGG